MGCDGGPPAYQVGECAQCDEIRELLPSGESSGNNIYSCEALWHLKHGWGSLGNESCGRFLGDIQRVKAEWEAACARVLGNGMVETVSKVLGDHTQHLTEEVRITSVSGGSKGSKLARYDLIPADVLWELAEHYGKGAEKYTKRDDAGNVIEAGDHNWRKGYDWSLSIAAIERHISLFKQGVDYDDDPSLPGPPSKHIIAAMWGCATLAWFMDNMPQYDDRWSTLAKRGES